MKAYAAEFLGTFWLVLGGCGSAVLAAAFPNVAVFAGDWAVAQLRLFWLAPIGGALLGAVAYRFIGSDEG